MEEGSLEMSRCSSCHAEFPPRPGNCPRCGSAALQHVSASAHGTVLAATELSTPATGWPVPHRLALVELPGGIRLLAIVDAPLPSPGARVRLTFDGTVYRAS